MNHQDYPKYKHIYYLHGALFLFKRSFKDLKIRKGADDIELVDLIANRIERGELPLFVSEGSPEDKLLSIRNSDYLWFALTKLEDANDHVVVFGTSLSAPDQHVVAALNRKPRRLAVSILVDDKSQEDLLSEMYQLKSKLTCHEIVFFDSSSLFQF
jgi:hypothetical protein